MNAKGIMSEGTLPATASAHPVTLGFTVFFEENSKKVFPSHQMKVPLNRYLGKGTCMFVTGVTLAELKELCGEGEEEMMGNGRSTDDEGSELSSSGDEEEDDDD